MTIEELASGAEYQYACLECGFLSEVQSAPVESSARLELEHERPGFPASHPDRHHTTTLQAISHDLRAKAQRELDLLRHTKAERTQIHRRGWSKGAKEQVSDLITAMRLVAKFPTIAAMIQQELDELTAAIENSDKEFRADISTLDRAAAPLQRYLDETNATVKRLEQAKKRIDEMRDSRKLRTREFSKPNVLIPEPTERELNQKYPCAECSSRVSLVAGPKPEYWRSLYPYITIANHIHPTKPGYCFNSGAELTEADLKAISANTATRAELNLRRAYDITRNDQPFPFS